MLLAPLALALEVENYQEYGSLEIEVKQEASLIAEEEMLGSMRIDSVMANLTFFPREGPYQFVLEQKLSAEPDAEITKDNAIMFSWTDINADKFKYFVDSRVQTVNKFPIVKWPTHFPPRDIGAEFMAYTEPTESIDITDEIKRTATEIIQGQTDYYKVVFKLADWVQKNVKYNLTTINEEAVIKASKVLETKEGVCDELTNLYIAFLRSVGIPARFVAGQAYSNIDHKFGNHGWAEVYFPKVGWVPVDVTYAQFGWVDPGHIKFKDEIEPKEPSASYLWKSRDTIMHINPIIVDSKVIKTLGIAEKHAELEVEVLREKAGPNSYMPVKVTVRNIRDYYLPLLVSITKAPEIVGPVRQTVLLDPHEERALFFLAKVPEELEEGYIYTATIEAKTTFGNNASAELELANSYEVYDEEWAAERIERLAPREDKSFLPNIELSCNLDKPHYYRDETAQLICSAKNIGNTNFKLAKICYGTNCHDTELLINGEAEAKWLIPINRMEEPDIKVTIESKNLIRYDYPVLRIIEKPKIVVHDFEPKVVRYGEESDFAFTVSSNFTAYNVTINVKDYGFAEIREVSEITEMLMPFNSKHFRHGNIEATVTYHDELGKEYSENYIYRMELVDIPWYIELLLWIERLLS